MASRERFGWGGTLVGVEPFCDDVGAADDECQNVWKWRIPVPSLSKLTSGREWFLVVRDLPRLKHVGRLVGWSWVACLSSHLLSRFAIALWLKHSRASTLRKISVQQQHRKRLSSGDWLYIPEVTPSSLHGAIVGLGNLYLLLKGTWRKDVVRPYPELLDRLYSFTVGYSIHDLIVMILHGDSASMYLHHFMALGGSLAMMNYRIASFFPSFFAISEVTVLPQNLMYLLSKAVGKRRFESGPAFGSMLVVRALFFFAFRTFLFPLALLYARRARFSMTDLKALPSVVVVGSAFNMMTLQMLNLYWTRGALVRLLQHWKMR